MALWCHHEALVLTTTTRIIITRKPNLLVSTPACRSLVAAAAELGGHPWLLSFSGMAEVLGWPTRLPLVAASDRERVLQMWGPACRGATPMQRFVPFAAVRSMSPEDFVRCLAQELQVGQGS